MKGIAVKNYIAKITEVFEDYEKAVMSERIKEGMKKARMRGEQAFKQNKA
ncbi:MAG: hypothetical protein HYW62_00900 [Candidatus Levybacteria bacterium]|nr:hypothetical protein [Candidatus Levybacteria bacterium]